MVDNINQQRVYLSAMEDFLGQDSVNQRLSFLVDTFEQGKKASFARKAGISPQAAQEILAGRRSEPSFKVLVKILENYPQVCTDWLVLGKGPMLKVDARQDASMPHTPHAAAALQLKAASLMQELSKEQEKYDRLREIESSLDAGILEAYNYINAEHGENEWVTKWLEQVTRAIDKIPGKFDSEIKLTQAGIKSLHIELASIHSEIAQIMESWTPSK
jgi:transcriptional regulator with XRE-family HTH domain